MRHSFCFYALLLFCVSLCRGLQIILPNTTALGADTPVKLVREQSDPGSFWLRISRTDGTNPGFYMQQVQNGASGATFNFPTLNSYMVEGVTNDDLANSKVFPQPRFAVSNTVQVVSDCKTENPTGMIVGILFGITFLLVCANVGVYVFIQRRRRQPSSSAMSSISSLRGYLASRYYGNPPPAQVQTSYAPSIISEEPYSPVKAMPMSVGYGSRRSGITIPIPLHTSRSFTDRQMQIRQRVYELQVAVLRLEMRNGGGGGGGGDVRLDAVNDEVDVLQLKTRIGTLGDYLESAWAMHRSDVMPQELAACF